MLKCCDNQIISLDNLPITLKKLYCSYNQLINLPNKVGYERLYRKDNIYDLIIVLNYNMRPVIKNKGSAIFIHLAKKNYSSTKGCVGLSKNNLLKILRMIDKNTKIKIL